MGKNDLARALLEPMAAFTHTAEAAGESVENAAGLLINAAAAISGQMIGREQAAAYLMSAAHQLLKEQTVDDAVDEGSAAPRH